MAKNGIWTTFLEMVEAMDMTEAEYVRELLRKHAEELARLGQAVEQLQVRTGATKSGDTQRAANAPPPERRADLQS